MRTAAKRRALNPRPKTKAVTGVDLERLVRRADVKPSEASTRHVAYIPGFPLEPKYGCRGYEDLNELLRVWCDDSRGVIVETVTTTRTFAHYSPPNK